MKTLKFTLSILGFCSIATFANAGSYDQDTIYAPVTDVQPIYKTIRVPQNHKVCENDNGNRNYNNNRNNNRNNSRQQENVGGAILGAIIGGVIGNQFGSGHGKQATTAAGVVAGASIGSKAKPAGYYSNGPRCYTKKDYYEEERIEGYDVSYDFNGRIYHTRLRNHPGDQVRIRVDVQVVGY